MPRDLSRPPSREVFTEAVQAREFGAWRAYYEAEWAELEEEIRFRLEALGLEGAELERRVLLEGARVVERPGPNLCFTAAGHRRVMPPGWKGHRGRGLDDPRYLKQVRYDPIRVVARNIDDDGGGGR